MARGHIGDVFGGVLHIAGRGTVQSMSIDVVLWWNLVVEFINNVCGTGPSVSQNIYMFLNSDLMAAWCMTQAMRSILELDS